MCRFDDGEGAMENMITKSGCYGSGGESNDNRDMVLNGKEKSQKRMLLARAAMRRG